MIIDNLAGFGAAGLLREYDGCLYQGKLIARRKDGHDTPNNEDATLIKSFTFNSHADIAKQYDRIKWMSERLNARFYVNLNPKKKKMVCVQVAGKMIERLSNDSYERMWKDYTSACSKSKGLKGEKTWLLDFDVKSDITYDINESVVGKWAGFYREDQQTAIDVLSVYRTPGGLHIIVRPFRRERNGVSTVWALFGRAFNEMSVDAKFELKENSPALCYYNAGLRGEV